jgi:hypothetical protein
MPGIKYDMATFDEVITQSSIDFMAKAKANDKPFLRLDEPHPLPRADTPVTQI